MIAIVDYGIGNVGSIRNMLERVGASVKITGAPQELRSATALVLPGVGAFDYGRKALTDTGLDGVLTELAVVKKVPTLGICLGMQLMTLTSEEGRLPGLGWISAATRRFASSLPNSRVALKVPHMGWNRVATVRENPLISDTSEEIRFYFVHSYFVECSDPSDVIAQSHYGAPFTAAFMCGNIMGVQFHPEKSHKFGMNLLEKFARLSRC